MCFDSTSKEMIASSSIRVMKLLTKDRDRFFSPFRYKELFLGKNKCYKNNFIHCFIYNEDIIATIADMISGSNRKDEYVLMECLVPEGSRYQLGVDLLYYPDIHNNLKINSHVFHAIIADKIIITNNRIL